MTAGFDLRRSRLPKGTVLLEASAGTGKTHTITGIALRLLLEGHVTGLPQILVVTFTVAATDELKNRLRRALTDAAAACESGHSDDPFLQHLAAAHGVDGARKLRAALAQADDMSVATIHGFCRRVLEEAAFESGTPFRSDFVEDEIPLLAEAARDAVRVCVQAHDALTAAVAVAGDLLPDDLLPQYRDFRRHADTALVPAPIPLDAALDPVRTIVAAVRALSASGDLPADLLDALPWKKEAKSPLVAARDGLARELRQRLADAGDPCLDWLLALDPAVLEDKLYARKRLPLTHALFGLCGRLGPAVATAVQALRQQLFSAMDERLADDKRRTNSLTFHDLLERVHATLNDPKLGKSLRAAIRARWQAALIDEFQDTDPLQYAVFATCFADQRLLLVGDPKQSIYGFRGADVHSYLQARDDAAAEHTLGENHRSHPQLVAAVEHLFRGSAAFAHVGIALPHVRPALAAADCALLGDDAPALQIRWLPPATGKTGNPTHHKEDFCETRVIADVTDECVRLLHREIRLSVARGEPRRLRAGDIAVLTRTNAQAVQMQEELRRAGVHSAIGKAGDVFKCPEMEAMQRLLTALGNPTWLPQLRAAWTTTLFGMDAAALAALDADSAALDQQLENAGRWRRIWLRHGFIVMFTDLLARVDARARLLLRPGGERALTNYLQIAELLHQAEMARQLAPESLVQWLEHERRHAQEIDYELRELRLESDADAVQILTLHGSKGLQYEVVFVPFAWGFRDPLTTRRPLLARLDDGSHVLDADPDGRDRPLHEQAVAKEALAEDLRLLYVGLTRARRRCIVHWAPTQRAHRSALAWLLVGPGRTDVDPLPAPSVWADALKGDYPRWRDDTAALVAESGGAIGLLDIPVDVPAARPVLRGAMATAPVVARPLPKARGPGFRIGSFSSMLARDGGHEPAIELGEPEPPPDPTPGAGSGIFAFARGAKPGICLHEILERADFAADPPAPPAMVRAVLSHHGLAEASSHAGPLDPEAAVAAMVRTVATARLGDLPFRLADLRPAARVAEWQFFLAAGRAFPRDLAPLFARHADAPWRGYDQRLAALPRAPLHGFLRGFVDLVAEHDGRWYVFDWKSNWLGDDSAHYTRDRLLADVQHNHYVLQYHLYLLALHRHLRARLRDYDYERCIGGACYVYLRGLGEGSGVFCDRPPCALIEDLDAWLAAEARR